MPVNVATLPLVLCGPLLRRVESHAVSVFVALNAPRWVQLKLYDDPDPFATGRFEDRPIAGIDYPLQPTVALGVRLHVVVATVAVPDPGLAPGRTYAYNLFFHTTPTDTGESYSLARTELGLLPSTNPYPLGYTPGRLPSFCLPPQELERVSIVHGSCRKPHGEGKDMLAALDDHLALGARYADPDRRPHLLLLTGDQIYADDVDPFLLKLVHDTGNDLLGWEERIPETGAAVPPAVTDLRATAAALATAATGTALDTLPPLPTRLSAAVDALEGLGFLIGDALTHGQVRHQLDGFVTEAESLVGAAGGGLTEPLKALAGDIHRWLTHFELFDVLRSFAHWGRVALTASDQDRALVAALRHQVELLVNADPPPQDVGFALGQLKAILMEPCDGQLLRELLGETNDELDALGPSPTWETVYVILAGVHERIKDDRALGYIPSRISPPQRAKELRQFAKLTSDAMTAHLAFLGEFYAMYLHVWSDVLWPRDEAGAITLPPYYEAIPNYGLTGALGPAALERAREDLAAFAADLPKVRRVLANVPTLMIFDDHEVSDDWNLNLDWVTSVNKSAMGPQLLRNALAAYAVFQDWGSQPDDYVDVDVDAVLPPAGRRLLAALTVPDGSPAPPPFAVRGDDQTEMSALLGVGPGAVPVVTEPYAAVPPEGRKRWDWEYVPVPDSPSPGPRSPFKVIALDTRTHRGFPTKQWAVRLNIPMFPPTDADSGGYVAAANLLQPAELQRQLEDRLDQDRPNLVISPAPVFGLPLLEELLQRLKALASGPEVADFEAWNGNPDGFERLVTALRGAQVVLLSGDVHYGFSNILSFLDGEQDLPGSEIVQLCSSSMKNETGQTRLLGKVGWEERLVEYVDFSSLTRENLEGQWRKIEDALRELRADLAADLPNFRTWFAETAPTAAFWDPETYATYYLALKDAMLLQVNLLLPRGLGAIGGGVVRYLFENLLGDEEDEGVPEHKGRWLQFLCDTRDDAARAAAARSLNPGGVVDALTDRDYKLRQASEIVGFNNLGKVSFAGDVRHELLWHTHDDQGDAEDVLASTIHGPVPPVASFREEIVRVAEAEYARWNPTGQPAITETDQAGRTILHEYHELLRPANAALRAITPPEGQLFIGFYGPIGGDGTVLHWSGTFISSVLWLAGAGDTFFYSPRHIDYLRRAKRDRPPATGGRFVLHDRTEAAATPEAGDLVVKWRGSRFGFDDIETDDRYFRRDAHVDVVVRASGGTIDVIGGNLGQRVRRTTYHLEDGRLRSEDDFIGLVKVREPT